MSPVLPPASQKIADEWDAAMARVDRTLAETGDMAAAFAARLDRCDEIGRIDVQIGERSWARIVS